MDRARSTDPRPASRGRDPDLGGVRAAQRDRRAFDVLYRRYLERVYGYAFYLLGDHHDAEDATERTFLSALAAIERFRDEGGTFRSWLFRIAHNVTLNAVRSRRRRRTAPLESAPEPRDPAADPAGVVARAEERRRVRAAVATLPLERRQVVVLRFVDGLSTQEIARILDRSEGAVRVLQHRALRDLAERLEP
jgi:RNA polymerase sigma-70 factor (ECF subfamily)